MSVKTGFTGGSPNGMVTSPLKPKGGVTVVVGTAETVIIAGEPTIDKKVKSLWIGNVHASAAATLTLYLVPTGVAAAAAYQLGGAVSYGVGTLVEEINGSELMIPAGYDLTGVASAASSIHVTASTETER